MVDYYKILDINENSSERDIKIGYNNQLKLLHPDRNGNGYSNIYLLDLVNHAYSILSNPIKRELYDVKSNNKINNNNFKQIQNRTLFDDAIIDDDIYKEYIIPYNEDSNHYSRSIEHVNINGKEYTIEIINNNGKITKNIY